MTLPTPMCAHSNQQDVYYKFVNYSAVDDLTAFDISNEWNVGYQLMAFPMGSSDNYYNFKYQCIQMEIISLSHQTKILAYHYMIFHVVIARYSFM